MRLKSLYVKILLSFLVVLFVTEILIFSLFVITAGRSFRHHLDNQNIAKLLFFKSIVQDRIKKAPHIPVSQREDIKIFLHKYANLLEMKIWMTDPKGDILIKTFIDPVETKQSYKKEPVVLEEGIKLFHLSKKRLRFYAQIPITDRDGLVNILHVHLTTKKHHPPEGLFLIGLLLIGTIIALLIIPLTRTFTKRINQLSGSALEFAEGNLSCRTDIKGNDEITDLGRSFNFMANKLEKMIQGNKELTANISHELRSPLARISVSNELIMDKLDESNKKSVQKYLINIGQDIKVLDKLIDSVLKLSKMDMQEPSLSKEIFNLKDLVDHLIEKFDPLIMQRGLSIKKEIHEPFPIQADKRTIESIMTNLLENAVKYTTENGNISISVSKHMGNAIRFSIVNTYRKLEIQELKLLFKPFFRIKEDTDQPGNGLGLTIIHKQVKMCNGTITAANTDNGLMFELTFPTV